MSATKQPCQDLILGQSPLRVALERFNAKFDYDLALPLPARDVESAAWIAEQRGKPEIALALRIALKEQMELEAMP